MYLLLNVCDLDIFDDIYSHAYHKTSRDLLPTAKAGGFLPPAESFLLHRPDLT